jgi:protein phosphatase
VHDLSVSEARYQGMGTTCTVAFVAEEEVVIAHVGDSRGYLLRDGELTRLTRDHSLVGELVDRGKVTEEEALLHPQRSVITRAVGPEAEVEVDTDRIAARAADLFLLCSDGLTDMVRERDLTPILTGSEDLAEVGRGLIAAANAAGGRDNITVILFRLEAVAFADAEEAAGHTTEQPAVSSSSAGASTGTAIREETTTAPPVPARRVPLPDDRHPPKAAEKKKGLRRFAAPLIVIGILLALFAFAGFVAMRGVFFVGLDKDRSVTIYRGLPYELPAGIELYTRDYTSGVRIDQVPADRRKTFTEHKLRSLDDAEDLVRQLESGTLK